jgi:hypothetical protein
MAAANTAVRVYYFKKVAQRATLSFQEKLI